MNDLAASQSGLSSGTEPKGSGKAELSTESGIAEQVHQAYGEQIQSFFSDEAEAGEQERLLLQHSWPLEPFAMPSLRETENRDSMPAPVLEAYDYYAQRIEAQDLGKVHGATLLVGEHITFSIYVETDGSDGWLEVYDIEGQLLGAARTELGEVRWGERAQVRSEAT